MLPRMLLIGCLTLSACASDAPVECDDADEAFFACMDGDEGKRFLTQGDSRAFFEKCIPLSEPAKFHGTWSTDFEFRAFSYHSGSQPHELK